MVNVKKNKIMLLHEAMLSVMYKHDPDNIGMTIKEITKWIVTYGLYKRSCDGKDVRDSQVSARASSRVKLFDKDFSGSRVLIKRKENFR